MNVSFGDNVFDGSFREKTVGGVNVLNFDPVRSLPGKRFNATLTTSWAAIPDFQHAANVTFAVDNGAPFYTPLGSVRYNEDLDLTDPLLVSSLADLETNLIFSPEGNRVGVRTSTEGMQPLNRSATLSVHPSRFGYSSGGDISITAISDAGTESMIYNKGQWYGKGGYVADSQDVAVGVGFISLPVLHFTEYRFDPGWTSPYVVVYNPGSGSDSDRSAYPPKPQGEAHPRPAGKSTVNVGGGSAITRAEVTGSGLANLIITSIPCGSFPSYIPSPDGPVYQMMEVMPARAGEIDSATLTFNVPSSWLSGKGLAKSDVALLVIENRSWITCPTEIIREEAGSVIYRARARHFQHCAIAYAKGSARYAPGAVTTRPTALPAEAAVQTVPGILAPREDASPVRATSPAVPHPAPSSTQQAPGFGSFALSVSIVMLIAIAIRKRQP